jgi:NAD(P)-dependent dehydrogenase (short-subunit alcohol dehydrogenase family)
MSYSVAGKNVLVTGASSGIGAGLAEGFARAGAKVGICARREPELRDVLARVREHSPDSTMWAVDLADLDGVEAFARRASADLGGIDVLVNNAGIPKRRRVTELDPATVEAVMAINYFSPVRLTLALLPELIERSGRIVNISSVAARLGPPSEAAYTASKAALTGWSESMQVDLGVAGTDVLVHVVNPGVIDTPLFHLPDNDESFADIEALPVEAMVEPVLQQLDAGTFEIYVPGWFADVVGGKFPDTGAFLAGTVDWTRQKLDSTPT